jgi:hypothetical protein
MIRYLYNCQTTPPAPFVHATLRSPGGERELVDVPALLDTAADRSVVPAKWAEELGLVPMRLLPVGGLGGHVAQIPTFLVQLTLREGPIIDLEILGVDAEPHLLLGRDALNYFRILLDGPRLALEIG